MMDGGEQVDGVPMLPSIAEWMRAFVDVHYKPEPRRKARRNDPFARRGVRATGREPAPLVYDLTMPDAPTDPKGFSLRRWSQRKHAAARDRADRGRQHRGPVGTALPDRLAGPPTHPRAALRRFHRQPPARPTPVAPHRQPPSPVPHPAPPCRCRRSSR